MSRFSLKRFFFTVRHHYTGPYSFPLQFQTALKCLLFGVSEMPTIHHQ